MFFIKKDHLITLMKVMIASCLIIEIMAGDTTNFNQLLKCNLEHKDIATLCNVDQEIAVYQRSLLNESNYFGCKILEEWIDPNHIYPDLHPAHQRLLDVIKTLNIKSVCDLGAGCGKISKYIYAQNSDLKITCVEHNSPHLNQMKENFQRRSGVILPSIQVNATIEKGSVPNLFFLPTEGHDLVFTCTVMMHLPFIIAVKSAQEIVRISKKYILHVENKNDGQDWYNMTIVNPVGMSLVNRVGVDYVRLYESLGVKTLQYVEFKDSDSPATFILYLGQK